MLLATQVLIYIFYAIVLLQLLYYIGIFSFFAFTTDKNFDVSEELPTSIIIAAKNEAVNLSDNLPYFANQNHTNFELIIVNDNSTDDTLKIINDFKKNNPLLPITIVSMQNGKGNKKLALSKGIALAKYPNLLFTDADCKPNSNNWITIMTTKLHKKQIVLGYGAYQKMKHSFLNKLIRFETVLTALQYFSYAKIGLPYMGVGRNLSYKKNLFIENNGFESHISIKSGDDDLFINQVATKDNTAICYKKEAHTISKVHTNFKKWIHQKKRHITTAGKYKTIHQLLLALFYLTNFLFWFLGIFLLLYVKNPTIILFSMLIRVAVQYFYWYKATKKLNEKDLLIFVPILEILLIAIQLYIFLSNLMVKPKSW